MGKIRRGVSLLAKEVPSYLQKRLKHQVNLRNDIEPKEARVRLKKKTKREKKSPPQLNFYDEDNTVCLEDVEYYTTDDDEYEDENVASFPPIRQTTNVIDHGCDDNHSIVSTNVHNEEEGESMCDIGTNIQTCDVSFDTCGDNASDWDVVSESKSEWDIISKGDETSIGSFDLIQSFHVLSYKDALLKLNTPMQQTKEDMNKSHSDERFGTSARDVRSRAIESILEDDECEVFHSSYFEYDGYKGARGGKAFSNSKKAPKASSKVHKAIQRSERGRIGRVDGRSCRRELRASVR